MNRFFFSLVGMLLAGLSSPALGQERILVMAEPGARERLAGAMQIELAGRSVSVMVTDPPTGATRMERAAQAQASARAIDATAAVWADTAQGAAGPTAVVRAAPGADGDLRQAPLPSEPDPDGRLFALVATSLIEELLEPPVAPSGGYTEVSIQVRIPDSTAASQQAATAEITPPRDPDAGADVRAEVPMVLLPVEDAVALDTSYGSRQGPRVFAAFSFGPGVLADALTTDGIFPFRGTLGVLFHGWRFGLEQETQFLVQKVPDNQDSLDLGIAFGVSGGYDFRLPNTGVELSLSGYLHAHWQSSAWSRWYPRDEPPSRPQPVYWQRDDLWAATTGVRASARIPFSDFEWLEIGAQLGLMHRTVTDRPSDRADARVFIGLSWQ